MQAKQNKIFFPEQTHEKNIYKNVEKIQLLILCILNKIIVNFVYTKSLKMETIKIKSQLQKMIDEQEDINVLQAIYTLLQKTSLNPILKIKLANRAKKAESDIAAGRVFTKEDIIQRTNRIGR